MEDFEEAIKKVQPSSSNFYFFSFFFNKEFLLDTQIRFLFLT